MRTVSHGVSTQNGTRQCRDSMNNIWRSEAEAKPSDVRSECALMSKKYIGNCRCQTCSNPESSRKAHIARSLHVWKECLRYLFYRGTVCRGDWAWLLINVTVTHSVFHWAWDHLTQCALELFAADQSDYVVVVLICPLILFIDNFTRIHYATRPNSSTSFPTLSFVISDRTLLTETQTQLDADQIRNG